MFSVHHLWTELLTAKYFSWYTDPPSLMKALASAFICQSEVHPPPSVFFELAHAEAICPISLHWSISAPTRAAFGGQTRGPRGRIWGWQGARTRLQAGPSCASSRCLLHLPGRAASLILEMTDYKIHYFPVTVTEHGSFKAKIWKLKKHLRYLFYYSY